MFGYFILTPILEDVKVLLRRLPFAERFIRSHYLKEDLLLDGVKLPFKYAEAISVFLTWTGESQIILLKFLFKNNPAIDKIQGMLKSDAKSKIYISMLHDKYVDYAVKQNGMGETTTPDHNLLPADYKYFGTDNSYDNMNYFIKFNPFFTASLRSNGDTFEVDPFGKLGDTYMTNLLKCLDVSQPRVAAVFDANMVCLSLKVYSAKNPDVELTGFTREKAATLLLFQCSYYAQLIHTTTHIFHLLMGAGLVHACKGTSLEAWSQPYIVNLYLKYVEVETVLLGKVGYLTGGGSVGYPVAKNSRDKVLAICKDMLCKWGSCKTADEYVWSFLFANLDPSAVATAGIADEFLKHSKLAAPFAAGMDKEFQTDPKYSNIQTLLKDFMSQTGTGVSEVENMQTWLELMSVTGVLHGCTLSMVRLALTHSVLSALSPDSDRFTARDTKWYGLLQGTGLGCLDDYHVYSNTMPGKTPTGVNRVLLEFDTKSALLKAEYFKKITEDAATFRDFGWILTDFGPNFVDGKQLTITTYI